MRAQWLLMKRVNASCLSMIQEGELAPRDVVSRAIFKHKQKTGKEVYLDLSAFEPEHFKQRFPSIYFNMTNIGYNVPQQRIPISPAFHYSMGGIKTDLVWQSFTRQRCVCRWRMCPYRRSWCEQTCE